MRWEVLEVVIAEEHPSLLGATPARWPPPHRALLQPLCPRSSPSFSRAAVNQAGHYVR